MSQENADDSGTGSVSGEKSGAKAQIVMEPGSSGQRWLARFTLLAVVVSLFLPLSVSGLWEPPERAVAELSRRIALNLLGGRDLVVSGANNEVPTRSELGRGELPFTSIAAGFRVFGLHEWAGRLPLALWGGVALGATYLLVKRLSERRTACFAVLVLLTMPLFFLHARMMLGEIVTLSALTMAWAGLGVAVFDRGEAGTRGARWLALGGGLLGILCGLLCRGLLIGVAVPALSVGLSWFALRGVRLIRAEVAGDLLGVLALGLGVSAGAIGCLALLHGAEHAQSFSWVLGSAINPPRVLPTFDNVLLQLGHALFPWSALIPLALGTLLRSPIITRNEGGAAWQREAALRALVLSLPSCAFFAYGISAPLLGPMPFAAVSALAVAVALFTRDLERGAPMSRSLPLVSCALAILLLVDFKNFPEKALSALCVSDLHFPEDFRSFAERLLSAGTLIFSGMLFFLLQERSTHADPRFDAREYRVWPNVVRELWAGNLLFALFVLEAALVGLCVLGFLAERVPAFSQLEGMSSASRSAALGSALALPVLLATPLLLLLVRDAFRTLFDPELGSLLGAGSLSRSLARGLSRAAVALLVGVAFGLSLSLGYYPMLARRISPKQVFEAYREQAKPGEALGMLGAGASGAAYYAGKNVPSFDTAPTAFAWLNAGQRRRWLVIHDSDLALINASYRAERDPARNLPVLDNSSDMLLVSNQLGRARNRNPLALYLPEQPPHPSHALDANLGNQLDVLGWDTLDLEAHPLASIEPGKHYVFVIYYRVVQPISGSWETFIHIDGFQRRFNGDHPTLDGKYPFNLWRVGDWIADRSEFALEPNFGSGKYRVYFGLYSGNRRLEVRRGSAQENRLDAGLLDVR